ncbi:MAG: exodeoxyribonuclease VII large subunit [Proteobacteria bacterium]|nr:exodeoxyribonuclease VII large subunit [Pseudomonadota bacterium]
MNIPEWTVSELSAALRKTVEDAYGYVRVRGEVSGYKGPSSSGHVYFRLKDQKAVLEAVIWKGIFGRMRWQPEEGLDVVATGKLTTFAGSSKYQIVVDSLEPAGVGALMALLEERKRKLAAEGLFDAARKQLLPSLPRVIGVVTSPTGAVIRDILHRLADRFPSHVIVWPVRVQGEGSAQEIAAAIHGFNALPDDGPIRRPDLIIVARGGGSLEDLWSFNEEIVVRAVAASMIPLISAVGHETDVTLIDFAADIRAPTPSAAAEMAVPVRVELLGRVDVGARRLVAAWMRAQDARKKDLAAMLRALPNRDGLLGASRQYLDALEARLPRALGANAHSHHLAYSRVAARLAPTLPRQRVERERTRLQVLQVRKAQSFGYGVERLRARFDRAVSRLAAAFRANLQSRRVLIAHHGERVRVVFARAVRAMRVDAAQRAARVERAATLLAALSHRGVLARGFAIVRGPGGAAVRAATEIRAGAALDIEFGDGHIGAVATGGGARSPTQARGAATVAGRRPRRGGQGSLFD